MHQPEVALVSGGARVSSTREDTRAWTLGPRAKMRLCPGRSSIPIFAAVLRSLMTNTCLLFGWICSLSLVGEICISPVPAHQRSVQLLRWGEDAIKRTAEHWTWKTGLAHCVSFRELNVPIHPCARVFATFCHIGY